MVGLALSLGLSLALGGGLAPAGAEDGGAPAVLHPGGVLSVNFTPWDGAPPALDAAGRRSGGGQQLAAGGESCGCKSDQSCCETVCCPSAQPHFCAATNKCYQTLTDAQSACGSEVEVCGVPQ